MYLYSRRRHMILGGAASDTAPSIAFPPAPTPEAFGADAFILANVLRNTRSRSVHDIFDLSLIHI